MPRDHHASHLGLLRRLTGTHPGPVHAVVVPTYRPVEHLVTAVDLAARLGCALLAVHGGLSDPAGILALAEQAGLRRCYLVRDSDALAGGGGFPVAMRPLHDPPLKQRRIASGRNLGLAVARLAGWSHVLFLDDDVRPADRGDALADGTGLKDPDGGRLGSTRELAADVAAAAAHLGRDVTVVGWRQRWYPDNSVVCHANRLAGNGQDCFVGGGMLLVEVTERTPFFPHVYNEDWFFLFEPLRRNAAGRGGDTRQLVFDPFADPRRAVDEEFGDVLGEGLLHLLHTAPGAPRDDLEATMCAPEHWAAELEHRRRLIGNVATQLDEGTGREVDERTRKAALDSLASAAERLAEITAQELAGFVAAWRTDLGHWRDLMTRWHPVGSAQAAFDVLHMPYETTLAERTD